MSTRYTLYIPNDAYSVRAKAIVREITALFRGHTQYQTEGVWYNESGQEVTEWVRVFVFLSTQPWHDLQYQIRVLERRLSVETGEDCILSHHEQTNLSFTLPLK